MSLGDIMINSFLKAKIIIGKLFIDTLFSSDNLIPCFANVPITSFALLFQEHHRQEPL